MTREWALHNSDNSIGSSPLLDLLQGMIHLVSIILLLINILHAALTAISLITCLIQAMELLQRETREDHLQQSLERLHLVLKFLNLRL